MFRQIIRSLLSDKMILLGLFWIVSTVMVDEAVAQPADCSIDAHCHGGFYCQSDHCAACIDCNNYHREPPKIKPICIKSVYKCGQCLEGYIEESSNDTLPPSCRAPSGGVPTWVMIVLPLVVIMLFCIIIVVALRRTNIVTNYKMSWMWRWVVGREQGGPEPEPRPPPYNAEAPPDFNHKYQGATCPSQWQMSQDDGRAPREPLGREPPPPPYSAPSASPTNHDAMMSRDESDPLMKYVKPPTLLAETNATATPYHRPLPTYTHAQHLDEDEDNGLNLYSPPNEVPDEETMESVWTPHPDDNVTHTEQRVPLNGEPVSTVGASGVSVASAAGGDGNSMLAQLAAARTTVLLQPPLRHARHPHHPHQSAPSPEGGAEGGPSGSSSQQSNINITLNLNNFNHQHIAG